MNCTHSIRRIVAALALAAVAGPAFAQAPQAPADPAASAFTVFLRSRAIGREEVAVVRQADGWIVRGSSRLGAPLDAVTRLAEIHYDADWRPERVRIDGSVRGQDISIATTFAGGKAENTVTVNGTPTTKVDTVDADAVVLPNAFLGSYAALARRLAGAAAGATFPAYILPQAQMPIRLQSVHAERIETPQRAIAASRYALAISTASPQGDLQVSLWADQNGDLLRISVPAQMLEIAREDIASAASRTTSFSLPGDESVRIPSTGFNLAATVTRPAHAAGKLPAIVLVGGSGPTDRDGFVAGIPVLGQLARALVDAGFLVVRYDKRGVGQSGGRTETATLADYAEDVRNIVRWLDRERDDVDDDRIALVGHSEGGLVALQVADRENKVKAVALVSTPSTTGAELVLEQQRHALDRLKLSDEEKQKRIALQQQIHAAILEGGSWEGVPEGLRETADTPWFASLLAFDPAKVIEDVRQPILVVTGDLDTQVKPYHAERLVELAQARRRDVAADLAIVPGVNHLLVPAKTGEVDEYGTLGDAKVSDALTAAIAAWMAKTLGPARR